MTLLSPFELDFWTRVGLTVFCGGIIGIERQLRGKPAGIRTSILICLGTQVFISLALAYKEVTPDPSRVLGQVVTGIGFLGAGVMMAKEDIVIGVTSAAIIWILAGIGAAIGLGYYAGALALTIVSVSVLLGVEALENSFRKLRRGAHARQEEGGWRAEDEAEG